MAWWKLEITDKYELTEDDLGHISELILAGFTEGELNDDELNNGEPMNMKIIDAYETADEARDEAIDWQRWASEQSLSYGELAEWQDHFEALGKKFGLTDEFRENGII